MKTTFLVLTAAVLMASAVLNAQTPATSIVPAAPAPAAAAQPAAQRTGGNPAMLMLLQGMNAANEETLKKQQATLQQLDELQQAADQIRIYTKRS